MLHSLVEKSGPRPAQFLPPCAGGGLVQVRLRVCSPPPHCLLHSPYGPQAEYPPSTGSSQKKKYTVSSQSPQTKL